MIETTKIRFWCKVHNVTLRGKGVRVQQNRAGWIKPNLEKLKCPAVKCGKTDLVCKYVIQCW